MLVFQCSPAFTCEPRRAPRPKFTGIEFNCRRAGSRGRPETSVGGARAEPAIGGTVVWLGDRDGGVELGLSRDDLYGGTQLQILSEGDFRICVGRDVWRAAENVGLPCLEP